MKIQVTRKFRYQATNIKLGILPPGIYRVPEDISKELADKALRYGNAKLLVEKKAPENKVVRVSENKADVAGTAGSSSGTRAKSKRKRRRRSKA